MLVSDADAALAGVFTTNRVQAAPVALCRERVAAGQARAVVINSGNANAATGDRGMADARKMAALAGEVLGIPAESVCICSTGTIGVFMPMDKIEAGIRQLPNALSDDGGDQAAAAIMTTDTVPKSVAVELDVNGHSVRIGGMAKGAGMIDPNMATMLAFLTTDAAVAAGDLQGCLGEAVNTSFNRITVDGDMSTNDTVLFMANGGAGVTLGPDDPAWPAFGEAVAEVTRRLALMIVKDGEGATKVVTVTVRGAASDADAGAVARAIGRSLLVKTSWFGGDPNWGRVLAATGYAGVAIDPEHVDIFYDDVCAARDGMAAGTDLAALEAVMAREAFGVAVDLHMGDGTDTVYSCDCSEEYVRINSEYMT